MLIVDGKNVFELDEKCLNKNIIPTDCKLTAEYIKKHKFEKSFFLKKIRDK